MRSIIEKFYLFYRMMPVNALRVPLNDLHSNQCRFKRVLLPFYRQSAEVALYEFVCEKFQLSQAICSQPSVEWPA